MRGNQLIPDVHLLFLSSSSDLLEVKGIHDSGLICSLVYQEVPARNRGSAPAIAI